MVLENPSESLVIIGNGFDLMHGVESSYWDFQKTIGKNTSFRFYMETYLDTSDLWSNLEESLGKLNYSIFLNPDIIDMWLDDFGAYNPDAQAADFFAAVETAIAPTFEIPRELKQRFKKWIKTLVVQSDDRRSQCSTEIIKCCPLITLNSLKLYMEQSQIMFVIFTDVERIEIMVSPVN